MSNLKSRKLAYKIWGRAQGKVRNERIAEESGLTLEEVIYYKEKDKWEQRLKKSIENGTVKNNIKSKIKDIRYKPDTASEKKALRRILDTSQLPDQQKLFVLYYLESYKIKWSAIQAGYSKKTAHVRGAHLMNDKKVSRCISRIKKLMHVKLYVKASDIIDEYVKIAFNDITEFVSFEGGKVTLKPSDEIDGKMITEVRQGRDGITLKMADKMKALERLEKLFEIIPDRRLQLDQDKFELTKELSDLAKSGATNVTIINDIGNS